MVSEPYIAATLEYVKLVNMNTRQAFDMKHWQYNKTIEAIRIIMQRGLDRVHGFEIELLVNESISFFAQPRVPGVDYKPTAFIKRQLLKSWE
jgi:hypothetical protein